MLAELLIPPGWSIALEFSGEAPPLNAHITAFHGKEWKGEVSATTSRLDQPGELQALVDFLTKRGVRA